MWCLLLICPEIQALIWRFNGMDILGRLVFLVWARFLFSILEG